MRDTRFSHGAIRRRVFIYIFVKKGFSRAKVPSFFRLNGLRHIRTLHGVRDTLEDADFRRSDYSIA